MENSLNEIENLNVENVKIIPDSTEIVYKPEMQLLYLDIAKIKEKDLFILKNTIDGSRLNDEHLRFNSFANISFADDDKKHQFGIIVPYASYNRLKVNCLIYDLKENVQNNGQYDKLFVFTTKGDGNYLSYIMYNTKTNVSSHKFLIENQADYLLQSLNRDFFIMLKSDVYQFYIDKGKAIKSYIRGNDKNIHIPSCGDYKKMLETVKQRHKKYSKRSSAVDVSIVA